MVGVVGVVGVVAVVVVVPDCRILDLHHRQADVLQQVRTEMCVDRCVDIFMDMCVDMCMDMGMNMCANVHRPCIDVHRHVGMRTGMCINAHRHVHTHVSEPIYKNISRHAY